MASVNGFKCLVHESLYFGVLRAFDCKGETLWACDQSHIRCCGLDFRRSASLDTARVSAVSSVSLLVFKIGILSVMSPLLIGADIVRKYFRLIVFPDNRMDKD
jgi:hypothetical protein